MRLIGNVEKDAQVRAVASGALPSGDAVIVNGDGTVSVVAGVAGGLGSASVYESATSSSHSPAFDSTNNKVVVAYRDGGNSNYGTAVVGTVSGTSISFGTPVVFASSNAIPSTTYDVNAQKIVIAYSDQTDTEKGKAIVGTVSGTSISFGTAVQFESGITDNLVAVYDPVATKPVFVYRDKGNSGYGTAIVGTVSGTSISFGSSSLFVSAAASGVSACYDSTSGKIVVAYRNSTTTNGNGAVGTVSGTSISFGSSTEFDSGNVGDAGIAPDTTSGKLIVSYKDGANSDYGTAVVATVSGTSISFGTPVVFESASVAGTVLAANTDTGQTALLYSSSGLQLRTAAVSGSTVSFGDKNTASSSASFFGLAYDANASAFVSTYRDGSNSNYGTARVVQFPSTNLTSENFLGFAAHTYADTQSALVNSTCTVDRNQSGLTAGQTYYVQTDGTLGTTAADPSVVAGTAISSTEIIVKG